VGRNGGSAERALTYSREKRKDKRERRRIFLIGEKNYCMTTCENAFLVASEGGPQSFKKSGHLYR